MVNEKKYVEDKIYIQTSKYVVVNFLFDLNGKKTCIQIDEIKI